MKIKFDKIKEKGYTEDLYFLKDQFGYVSRRMTHIMEKKQKRSKILLMKLKIIKPM